MISNRFLSSRGANSWLILVVLVACCTETHGFRPYSGISSTPGTFTQFGCSFENANYFVRASSIFTPVYGQPVQPMNIRNVAEFNKIIKTINEVYANLMAEQVFSNIPVYFNFYDTYKGTDNTALQLYGQHLDFTAFFQNFIPQYFPARYCTSMAIELYNRLTQRIPGIGGSIQLITVSLYASNSLLNKLGLSGSSGTFSRLQPNTMEFKHNHVAALLRFKIGGRLGYVLLDPGLGLNRGIVAMQDRGPPNISNMRDTMSFSFLQSYILAKFIDPSSPNFGKSHVYYIGKPYCSFEMTTIKAHLTRSFRNIARRDSNGRVTAFISFDVHKTPTMFTMGLRVDGRFQTQKILFGTRHQLNQTELQHYQQVIRTINHPNLEFMLVKAEYIAQDRQFIANTKHFDSYFDTYRNSRY